MGEIWKDIDGFDGLYQISNHGRVKSFKRYREGRILKPARYTNGYLFVHLTPRNATKRGKYPRQLVHRLVAQTFIVNPNNYPCVNHINGIKDCNFYWNLEWCTKRQNTQHAIETGLITSVNHVQRRVEITCDNVRICFKTMQECCEYFNFTKCWLGNYIRKHGNPCTYNGWRIQVFERR